MDWSQMIFAAGLLAAIMTGKPARIVAAAMVLNFVATVVYSANPVAVGIADLIAVVMLIGESKRANTIAALFVAMTPIYPAGNYLGLNNSAIYALVDVLAFAQLVILGGWDVGIGNRLGALRRWHFSADRSAPDRHHPASNMGRSVPVVSESRGLK